MVWITRQGNVGGFGWIASWDERYGVVATVGERDVAYPVRDGCLRPEDIAHYVAARWRDRNPVGPEQRHAIVLGRLQGIISASWRLESEIADPDIAARVECNSPTGTLETAAEIRRTRKVL